ncbi:acyl carrier protein [Bdellovibrio reynosensis]|uniref:Acyl carrier protein n=1 Tax=Bdellovibrio reynosensis TaxID=2835041 RepID=A0ABY4CB92_9BACT|nr:acyl carrier protein [Bdellovibrio reynosensis]UOF02243.1 acyl carrier protein [Bdellovibrio reynosensis]
MSDIKITLFHFIMERMANEGQNIDENTSLFKDHLLDSLAFTELILMIEKKWSIQVEPFEMVFDNFDTVENLEQYISEKINGT